MKNTAITTSSFRSLALSAAAALVLAACGGSSGSSRTAAPPPTPPPTGGTGSGNSGPVFQAGVFAPEGDFVAQCQTPRTGTDPSTGNPFVDRQGSTALENFWLRSWSNRTYLWFDEITDVNPYDFDDRLAYFDLLKTEAVTPSGAPRDQFHFTQDTAERFQRVSTGASASFGSRLAILESRPPRDVRVVYTEAVSPFADNNVRRGAKILEIDGVDVVNGATQADVDVINNALFPSEVGQTHTFVIEDTPGAAPRTFTASAATVTSEPVLVTDVIEQGDDKVGYIVFNTFGTSIAERALFDAFTELSSEGVSDLVLDLRYNGGGFLTIASQLGYMVAGSNTAGRVFETLQFNSKFPTTDPVTGRRITPTPFISQGQDFSVDQGTPLPTVNLNRVFVLSTARTCSASEALINGLSGIDAEVILIGATTCGKPYGFYTTDNCGVSYSTIQFRGVNAKNFGDYADGFTPAVPGQTVFGEALNGCQVADDLNFPLGAEDEPLLSAALTYRSTGACPAPSAASSKNTASPSKAKKTGLSLTDSPIYQRELFFEQRALRNTPPSMVNKDAISNFQGSE
jgi:hypothetical protein